MTTEKFDFWADINLYYDGEKVESITLRPGDSLETELYNGNYRIELVEVRAAPKENRELWLDEVPEDYAGPTPQHVRDDDDGR